MKKNIIKSIKGFKDILPDEAKLYRYFEDISSKVSERFSIEELRTPIIEKSELFNRSRSHEKTPPQQCCAFEK